MSLFLKEPEKSFRLIPNGTYSAVCTAIIDLGEALDDKWDKRSRKVLLSWELEYDDENGELRRATKSKSYTFSFHEKATLRADLEKWRGRKFTAEELQGFNLVDVLGKPCMLQIVQYDRGNGLKDGINAILSLPKGMPAIQPSKPPVVFDCEESPLTDLEELPDWVREQIKASDTYKQRLVGTFDDLSADDEEVPF